MIENTICPACKKEIRAKISLRKNKEIITCPKCDAKLMKEEIPYGSLAIVTAISFLTISVGVSSILFYLGENESTAKYSGLFMTLIFLLFWIKKSRKWSVHNDK